MLQELSNGTSRTNYFRVTDEEKYKELLGMLTSEDTIEDFTETGADGIIRHSFGAYGDIDYYDEEQDDYDFGKWISQLQEILPDDDSFNMERYKYEIKRI